MAIVAGELLQKGFFFGSRRVVAEACWLQKRGCNKAGHLLQKQVGCYSGAVAEACACRRRVVAVLQSFFGKKSR